MRLSILVPGIRPKNWQRLYESVNVNDFEMIFVGPYAPPEILRLPNVKYIHSFRSPCACQQIALHYATGEYITWASDDGIFLPSALQYLFDILKTDNVHNPNQVQEYKKIVVGKYLEGDNPENMESDDYYRFKYHKAYRIKGIPPECLIFNCGIISRKFLIELGGWDAENFEVPTIGHADLGIRAYNAGAEMVLQDKMMFKCSHQPGKTGDHKPIHNAMKKDLKTLKQIYSKPRQPVEIDNWKQTPMRWKERFK